jgi:hypothetical protein
MYANGLAFLYSCFSAIGISLLFLAHGNWFVTAKELGMPYTVDVELTIMKTLCLGFPYIISVFVSVFIIVNLSEHLEKRICVFKQKHPHPDIIFPLVIFCLIFIGSIMGCYAIPLAFNWVNIIGSLLFSGICGISYFWHIYLMRMRNRLNSLKKNVRDHRLFAKRLELEHNSLQETLHWFIWCILIFVTAGALTILIHPFEQTPPKLLNLITLNTIIIGFWCFLGFWFGVIGSISGSMLYLRILLEELSLGKE